MESRQKSLRRTPWDNQKEFTATQEFLKMHYQTRYEERHPTISETAEARMINSYIPKKCPFCSSEDFVKIGYDSNGIRRYTLIQDSIVIDISLEDLVELNQEFKRYVKVLKANGIETTTQMVDHYYACKLKEYHGLGKKFYGLIRDFITNQKSYREQYYDQHHEEDSLLMQTNSDQNKGVEQHGKTRRSYSRWRCQRTSPSACPFG